MELCVMYSQRVIILFYFIWFDLISLTFHMRRIASLGSAFCFWLLLLNRLSIFFPLFVFFTVLAPRLTLIEYKYKRKYKYANK